MSNLYEQFRSLAWQFADYTSRLVWLSLFGILAVIIMVFPCVFTSFTGNLVQVFILGGLGFLFLSIIYGLIVRGQTMPSKETSTAQQLYDWLEKQRKLTIALNVLYKMAIITLLIGLVLLFFSFKEPKDEEGLEITIVQVNDVYEIGGLDSGRLGSLARVAALKQAQKKKNPNTILLMAGDFLSPSVFNNVQYNGEKVQGKQMIEAMNAAGFDMVAFGNHEFDIDEQDLIKRIDESRFEWVASNTFHKKKICREAFKQNGKSLQPIIFRTFINNKGESARIGFIGITVDDNRPKYVDYDTPANTTAKRLYNQYKDSCDAIIAITHQNMADDEKLAIQVPGLAAILGGHEHDGRLKRIGNVVITKAYSNAKTAYVIKIRVHKNKKRITVSPERVKLDAKVQVDSTILSLANRWKQRSYDYYKSLAFLPDDIVLNCGSALEGRDEFVRKGPTNLTMLITDAMTYAYPQAQLALFNAGAIRIDDIMPMPVTQYDILRALPYMDSVKLVEMKGQTLTDMLQAGKSVPEGNGMFLQYSAAVRFDEKLKSWLLNGKAIAKDTLYRVAVAKFTLDEELKKNPVPDIKPVTPSETRGNVSNMDHILISYIKEMNK